MIKKTLFLLVIGCLAANSPITYGSDHQAYERFDEQKTSATTQDQKSTSLNLIEMLAKSYCKTNTKTCKKIAHTIGDPLFKIVGLNRSLIDDAIDAWVKNKTLDPNKVAAMARE